MKRFLALLLCAAMLLSLAAPALAADQPKPISVLTKDQIRPTPKGIHHYMLICIDAWKTDLKKKGYHTDGLVLVTVDELAKRVMLTSFIREMLIQRPDGAYGRINNFLDPKGWTYENNKTPYEGFQALIDTINCHFDLNIEKYIVMNFQQVENIINSLGGVQMKITSREAENLVNYFGLSRSAAQPRLGSSPDGTYLLSGEAAVLFMRIRKIRTEDYLHADGTIRHDTGDLGRTYRTRKTLAAIADSLKDITLDEAMKLKDAVVNNTVYTNMTSADMLDALNLAMQFRGVPVEGIRMPYNEDYNDLHVSGMNVIEIDFEKNRQVLWDDFFLKSFVVVDEEE